MRFLSLIFALCLADSAFGAHAVFRFTTRDTQPQVGRPFSLYPVPDSITNGNGTITTRDRMSGTTDKKGQITISNLYGGSILGVYRGELKGKFTTTTNWYQFPNTNNLIDASSYVTAPTNVPGGGRAYTTAQTDAMIAGLTNANLYNQKLRVDPTNGNNLTAVRGDDGHPYATIQAALAAALSGDWVNPIGYMTTTEQVVVPSGVHVIGDFVLNTSFTNATKAAFVPGANSFIRFQRLIATNGFQFPVGCSSDDPVPSNAHIYGIIDGDSDGLYYSALTQFTNYYDGPEINSHWDAVAQYSSANTYVRNTTINVTAGNWTNQISGANGLRADAGFIWANNVRINVTGNTNRNACVSVGFGHIVDNASKIWIDNCILNSYGTSRTNADIFNGYIYDDLDPELICPLFVGNCTRYDGQSLGVYGLPSANGRADRVYWKGGLSSTNGFELPQGVFTGNGDRITNTGVTITTNATLPVNASTIRAWMNVTNDQGKVGKIPVYY